MVAQDLIGQRGRAKKTLAHDGHGIDLGWVHAGFHCRDLPFAEFVDLQGAIRADDLAHFVSLHLLTPKESDSNMQDEARWWKPCAT
ncbi:MAG: hypothetical protein WBF84_16965 [Castellaniella sp.]|uniref:hypothetical protein n=1 Tax=Castellaniella sp. TaxID=1955812 RepID=UPI003C736840